MTKKNILFFFFLFPYFYLSAQTAPDKYWVQFTDKNNSPYSLSTPSGFLSLRAIERREIQQIPLIENDLPVNPSYVDSVAGTGALIINKSKWFNAVTIATDDSTVLTKVASFSFVKQIRGVNRMKSLNQEDDKFLFDADRGVLFCEPPADSSDYGSSFNQIDMLSGFNLHISGYKGAGRIIAVLDAGFFGVDTISAFDTLWKNNRIIGTRDFVTRDTMVFEDHAHGMYVLSVMGGWIPGALIGTAPEASYLLLRTEDAASEFIIEEDNWVAAAEFADSAGVDIINSSLGYTTFDDPAHDHTYADMNGNSTRITIGADIAASKGIIVVNSAGNSGEDSWNFIGAPADGFNVMAVGAVDALGNYASFSSKGPSFDGRVKPNISAQGKGTIIALHSGGVMPANGTAFSAPLISGLVACLWQINPLKTASEVFKAIEESAHLHNNPDSLYGYGIPNFSLAAMLISDSSLFAIPEKDEFQFYPNPFNNFLTFEYFIKEEQQLKIEVFDFNGKKVFSKEALGSKNSFCRFNINESEKWGSGVYIITVSNPSGYIKKQKIIKF